MKTLIKMTDFVKEQKPNAMSNSLSNIINYANFLSLTPEIWQFVPCKLVDGVWVVLELPKDNSYLGGRGATDAIKLLKYEEELAEYQTAKERCYFDGFEVIEEKFISKTHYYIVFNNLKIAWNYNGKWNFYKEFKTIEDLIPYNLPLTATAQKEIGL